MFFVRAYLWFAPNLLLLIALRWIFRRKLHTQYAIFAAYLLQLAYFATALTVDLLIPRHLASRNIYLWTLIFGLGLSAVTEMALLYELAAKLIFSRFKDSSPLKNILHWTAGTSVLLAVLASAS